MKTFWFYLVFWVLYFGVGYMGLQDLMRNSYPNLERTLQSVRF